MTIEILANSKKIPNMRHVCNHVHMDNYLLVLKNFMILTSGHWLNRLLTITETITLKVGAYKTTICGCVGVFNQSDVAVKEKF